MKRTLLAAMLSAVAAHSAFAAIGRPESGNGELFLAVGNTVAQVSFVFDTGIRMDDFFAQGETPGFAPAFNISAAPGWAEFQAAVTLGGSSLAETAWAVIAFDSTGGTSVPGLQRLLTTARQNPAGIAATIDQVDNTTNMQFSSIANGIPAFNFHDAINTTGTHGAVGSAPDFSVNGSSFNPASTPGFAYFGRQGGLTPTFNGIAPFNSTNLISPTATSNFFYLTRSGPSNLSTARVLVDPFQGPGDGVYSVWSFDGNTLAYAVPEPSTYALLAGGLIAVGAFVRRRRQN